MFKIENIPWNMKEEEFDIIIDTSSDIGHWIIDNYNVYEDGKGISVGIPIGTILPNGYPVKKSSGGQLHYTKKQLVKKTLDDLKEQVAVAISFFNLGKEI